MKKVLSLFLLVMLLASAILLVSCGKNKDDQNLPDDSQNSVEDNQNSDASKKQTPVYQGMTITSVKSYSALSYAGGKDNFDYEKDNGNHNGHFKGDYFGKDHDFDKNHPFPDNDKNENIEEEIKSSLNVIGSPDEIYYATPNEDIYINIHIHNPDSFEIMSFTLNGKKYSSYMFEDGSDMETIVLKYNVGSSAGIVEYTIDAIKYVDGTEIKDVIIEGNKTVMAGIRTENQVAANVTDVDVDTNALSFNVNVKDNNSLIDFSNGALKAVIYDGFNIVSEKDITVGDNVVSFQGLKTNTVYQYAIVGYYDDLSGNGFVMNVLYKDAFCTDSVVLFDNITVGQESISFGYLWHEDHQGKAVSALKLYKDEAFVQDLEASATAITGLLSDTTYKLVAEYPNGDKPERIYLEFTTLAKATPEVSVINPIKTQTSLSFEIAETDIDNVGEITKIELVHANGTVVAASLEQRNFADLLSNNAYTVKVTYVYDLNDGVGNREIVNELAITTLAKATPEVSVINPTKTQTSLSFEIAETDTDNVGEITKIELVHANGTVVADSLEQRNFADLLSNNAYTVKVTYVYDLNDGVGNREIVKELAITTLAKATPEISVSASDKTQTSIGFAIAETDTDNVGAVTKIELVHANGIIVADSLEQRTFANLLSNNTYTVKITYVYDLNDGEGEHTITREVAITTDAKATPDITITNTAKGQESLNYSIIVTDTDSVGTITKVELIHGTEITTLENVTTHEIKNLLSNNDYSLRVTYTYNLNDGFGERMLIKELSARTVAKAMPEILLNTPTKTQTSIGFAIAETDTDNVGAVTKIELVHASGTVVAENIDVRNFTGLLSNNTYTVKITYAYDLNDGEGEHTVTKELAITTLAKATPEISVSASDKTQTSIGFAIAETDTDNVGAVTKIELVHASGTVVAENVDVRSFDELLSNNNYTIRVSYTYNLNDGVGDREIVDEFTVKTEAKTTPSFTVKNEDISTDSINAEYDIIDVDNILASYKVELYIGVTQISENAEKKISYASLNYKHD